MLSAAFSFCISTAGRSQETRVSEHDQRGLSCRMYLAQRRPRRVSGFERSEASQRLFFATIKFLLAVCGLKYCRRFFFVSLFEPGAFRSPGYVGRIEVVDGLRSPRRPSDRRVRQGFPQSSRRRGILSMCRTAKLDYTTEPNVELPSSLIRSSWCVDSPREFRSVALPSSPLVAPHDEKVSFRRTRPYRSRLAANWTRDPHTPFPPCRRCPVNLLSP